MDCNVSLRCSKTQLIEDQNMKDNYIINIEHQFGSGAWQIGEILSKRLNFLFCDSKKLISLASLQSGLSKYFFEKIDENHQFIFDIGLHVLGISTPYNNFMNNYLSEENLFKIQSDVIYDLGQEKSCVFMGHCADYIFRNYPHVLNVFISAEQSDRIQLIQNHYQTTEKNALKLIKKYDKRRARYYNYYSNKEWGVSESYHLCINASTLGIEATADFIQNFFNQKLQQS